MRQTIIAVAIALLAVIFALQNSAAQTLRIFFWDLEMPLSLMILATLIVGIIAGMLIMTKPYLQKGRKADDIKTS